MKFFRFSDCLCLSMQLAVVGIASGVEPLEKMGGTYLQKSKNCTAATHPNGKGEWEGCASDVFDCLSIKPISNDKAIISVMSIQMGGSACAAEGTGVVRKPGVLVVSGKDLELSDSSSQDETLEVDYSGRRITIGGPQELCGVGATWYDVGFERKHLKTREALDCSSKRLRDLFKAHR